MENISSQKNAIWWLENVITVSGILLLSFLFILKMPVCSLLVLYILDNRKAQYSMFAYNVQITVLMSKHTTYV